MFSGRMIDVADALFSGMMIADADAWFSGRMIADADALKSVPTGGPYRTLYLLEMRSGGVVNWL